MDLPITQVIKNLPAMQETRVQSMGREDPLGKGMAIHSSILAWRTPRTEKPGGLQFMRSQRVGHDWVSNTHRPVGIHLTNSYFCWQKISQNCEQHEDSRGSFHYPSPGSHLLLWWLRGRATRGNGNLKTNRQELISVMRFPFSSVTIFYWRIIALQCGIRFCCPTRWVNHKDTYIPFFQCLPPRPPSWAPCPIEQLPTSYLLYTW